MDPTPCEETQIQGYPDGCQDSSKRYSKEKKVKNKSKTKTECDNYQAVNFQKRNKVEAELVVEQVEQPQEFIFLGGDIIT